MKYDFQGWATKNNVQCLDGRTILQDAFKDNDGKKVPIIWNHDRSAPENVLGHGFLENRPEGVWVYGMFNQSEKGCIARDLTHSGDLDSLSIFASILQKDGPRVQKGDIKEVSLVLAGANPEAKIETVIQHSDGGPEEAYIRFISADTKLIMDCDQIVHSAESKEDSQMAAAKEATLEEIVDSMSDEQRDALVYLVAQAMEEPEDDNENEDEEEDDMKHNFYEGNNNTGNEYLSHAAEYLAAANDAKRFGSMREAFIEHGITNIDIMFPDAMDVMGPQLVSRDMTWVDNVMTKTHHTPFSRIKTVVADITEAEARAKGYIKGHLKKEEVFALLKRSTGPTTVYKKQKLERDDVIDIKDFDIIVFLKAEMRLMLNEEIARAFLVGDGRLADSEDKIKEDCIRPIYKDADLYSVKVRLEAPLTAVGDDRAKAFIKAITKARKLYKGSGSPTGYFPEDIITDCLLLTDTTGRDIYDSIDKLTTKLRLKEIVPVPVMDGLTRIDATKTYELLGIIVNLTDYNVGTDKGGEVNMFDDFDIDYNANKYLIESRCSGALVKPMSALVIEMEVTPAQG